MKSFFKLLCFYRILSFCSNNKALSTNGCSSSKQNVYENFRYLKDSYIELKRKQDKC